MAGGLVGGFTVWLTRILGCIDHLGWLIEHREGELALRLSGALWWFWFMHGDWRAGRRWLAAA